jgi:hypothetical protein
MKKSRGGGPRFVGFTFVSDENQAREMAQQYLNQPSVTSRRKPPTVKTKTKKKKPPVVDDDECHQTMMTIKTRYRRIDSSGDSSSSEDERPRKKQKKRLHPTESSSSDSSDSTEEEKEDKRRIHKVEIKKQHYGSSSGSSSSDMTAEDGEEGDVTASDDGEDEYFSSESHSFDEEAYECDMRAKGFTEIRKGRGCNHREHCRDGCALYHDYRRPGRRHYYSERGSPNYTPCIYGRYVRETDSTNLIRLESDSSSSASGSDGEDDLRQGWHHEKTCPTNCRRYHYKDAMFGTRFARSRDGCFHPASYGRWIKDFTCRGVVFIRVGPNDEQDYDFERDSLMRLSTTMPPVASTAESVVTSKTKQQQQHTRLTNKKAMEVAPSTPDSPVTSVSPQPPQQPQPIVFHRSTGEELLAYFKQTIKNEDLALRELVKQMGSLRKPPMPLRANIIKVIAAGTPGTGKTTIALLLRQLFGMQKGGANEACYICCRLGNYSDDSHANRVAGTGPGFIGFGVRSLMDEFVAALAHIRRTRAQDDEWEHGPRVILFHMDEVCKTTNKVLDAFNSLLAEGVLHGATPDVKFELPDDVFLFVYGTSNFGEHEISAMPVASLHAAREAVERAMHEKSIAVCNIRRLGAVIPFFAIERSDVIETIFQRCRRDECDPSVPVEVKSHYLHSLGHMAQMSDSELRRFIEYCVNGTYVKTHGITNSIEFITQQLDHNRATHEDAIVTQLRRQGHNDWIEWQPCNVPVLTFHLIDCSEEQEMTRDKLLREYPCMREVLQSELNGPDVELCLQNRWPIAYIQMRCETLALQSVNIISPLVPTEQQQQLIEQERLNHAAVKEEKEPVLLLPHADTSLTSILSKEQPRQQRVKKPEQRRRERHHSSSSSSETECVDEKKEEEQTRVVKRKRVKRETEEVGEETDQHHQWVLDKKESNRKTAVYVCQCEGPSRKHYKRPCSAGLQCKGTGVRYSRLRGYCTGCVSTSK